MEYGYSSSSPDNKKGLHFTMSSRNDMLLIGSSREDIHFDATNGIGEIENDILQHAKIFVRDGTIEDNISTNRRLGFRPSCSENKNADNNRRYCIKQMYDGKVILVYGFEGQGVLYSSLAGRDVVELLLTKKKLSKSSSTNQ